VLLVLRNCTFLVFEATSKIMARLWLRWWMHLIALAEESAAQIKILQWILLIPKWDETFHKDDDEHEELRIWVNEPNV